MTLEMVVLFGFCWFLANIFESLGISIFNENV